MRNSNSIQILSCVMCCKQSSSLTKAVHGTACNTSAGLQVLLSRLALRDLSNKGPNNKHSLEEQLWHLTLTTSTLANGKTRMVPKPGKFSAAWFLASNLTDVPLGMKCQVNSEKSQIFPNTKPICFLLRKLVATYNFATSLFCTTTPHLGPI